jgi:hypothetical protein
MQSWPSSVLSYISKVLEVSDIFTRKDAISGLKNGPCEGLGKLVYTALGSSILKYDITTN